MILGSFMSELSKTSRREKRGAELQSLLVGPHYPHRGHSWLSSTFMTGSFSTALLTVDLRVSYMDISSAGLDISQL